MVLPTKCRGVHGRVSLPPTHCEYQWHSSSANLSTFVCAQLRYDLILLFFQCLYVLFRLIHLSLDWLFLTSLTCCPVCAYRYFELHIKKKIYRFCWISLFSVLYTSCFYSQVYYTFRDACRDNKCPLQKEGLTGECWQQLHLVGSCQFDILTQFFDW